MAAPLTLAIIFLEASVAAATFLFAGWMWALIVALLLVAGGYLLLYASVPTPMNFSATILEAFKKSTATGDLVFLCGLSTGETNIRMITGSAVSHVALVVREGDAIFLWEADAGKGYRAGARMIPLLDKLAGATIGTTMVWRRCLRGAPSTEQILEFSKANLDRGFDGKMTRWLTAHNKAPSEKPSCDTQKDVFCSELVAETLQHCGALSKDQPAAAHSPNDLLMDRVQWAPGVIYGMPLRIDISDPRGLAQH